MTTPRGILAIPAADYHADQVADQPTLSASIAHLLCASSPAHARAAHPKLNPDFQREEKEQFDVGTVAHALLLQGEDIAEVLDYPDWRTNAAKAARDEARANGRVPLLRKNWDAVQAMVAAARDQLAAHRADPQPFTDGKPEQPLVWEEDGGVVCRALIDWLRDDMRAVDDLKTTAGSANPDSWTRSALFAIGADVQVAFYLRGLATIGAADVEWRYVVQETFPPYALSVVSLGPDVLTVARKKVEYAIDLWRRCLGSGVWPGYPAEVCWAELPAWEEARWLEKEVREAA